MLWHCAWLPLNPAHFLWVNVVCGLQSTWAGVNEMFAASKRRDYQCSRFAGTALGSAAATINQHPSPRLCCSLADATGVFGPKIAEYALAWTVAVERGFSTSIAQQQNKVWSSSSLHDYRSLSDMTMRWARGQSCGWQRHTQSHSHTSMIFLLQRAGLW